MCEVCEFRQVTSFDSAMKFAKRYVQRRLDNLLKLHKHNQYEEFMKTYGLPEEKLQVIFEKFSSAFVALLNCEGWEITVEELLQKLEHLGFEHVLYGLENQFPEPIRRRIVDDMITLKTQDERLSEKFCNLLYNVDRFIQ